VTAKEALCDLPKIKRHLNGNLKRGARRFDELVRYPEGAPQTAYSRLMREWKGFENEKGVWDHSGAIRYLPRDYDIFARMDPGDQYPEAHEKAKQLFREHLAEVEREEGGAIPEGSERYEELWSNTVPPYDPSNFPNKWRKMEPDAPARTLMAHLGKDSYSHIHYDSEQARTISVREAARLQSFPDGFKFAGTMNPAFRQIGNAVPPLLSYAIAHKVAVAIGARPTPVTSRIQLYAK
jgi:DNA (cytosine-5)-methyltransferase 1